MKCLISGCLCSNFRNVFNWCSSSPVSFQSIRWRTSKTRKEQSGILLNPLHSLHMHSPSVERFSNWGRHDNTCLSVTLCLWMVYQYTPTPAPSPNKKKKINPVSGDHALALAIGWIISKQRTRSFETWEGGTCCLQQLALSIEKWSPIVSQMTNLPSGTWLYCLGQTLPWLSLSSLFFTRPLH